GVSQRPELVTEGLSSPRGDAVPCRSSTLCEQESRLHALFEFIKAREENHGQERIRQGRDHRMSPAEGLIASNQPQNDDHINHAMDQEEDKGHQKPGTGIVHVQLYTQRRRQEANDHFGNPVYTDRKRGPGVLQAADQSTGYHSRNRPATRHGKKDGHQQRQVEDREEVKPEREKYLDKDRQDGNAEGDRPAKPMDLNLFPRSE